LLHLHENADVKIRTSGSRVCFQSEADIRFAALFTGNLSEW